jgi:hypothetical protein
MAKANFEAARNQFASTAMGEEEWVGVFDSNPDIMWAILADVYSVVKDEEEREAGKKRMGRRPTRVAGSVDELMRTVMPPQYTTEPFPAALKKLLAGRSQRQFAPRVPITQPTLSRLLKGEWEPDLAMLERIAAAAKVPPFYFVEYRAQMIAAVVTRILIDQPNLGITAYKRMRGANA